MVVVCTCRHYKACLKMSRVVTVPNLISSFNNLNVGRPPRLSSGLAAKPTRRQSTAGIPAREYGEEAPSRIAAVHSSQSLRCSRILQKWKT